MPKETVIEYWNKKAEALKGKKIAVARYMTKEEADHFGWNQVPLVIQFTDGSTLFASRDDEGNGAGALFGDDNGKNMDFPVIAKDWMHSPMG
jgi:hypothetical protein